MTDSESAGTEVLTLAETAEYLRVPEQAILDLVAKEVLPARQINGEWRFLKRAVAEWLRSGPHFRHDFKMFPPPWMFDHPFWEDFFQALESRILRRVQSAGQQPAEPGSKQAVLKHFGVFKDDADVDEQLAGVRARRRPGG